MRFLRFGVCLLITFAVAAHGVVEVWSESALEIGAALLFLCWGIANFGSRDARIYWSNLHWPLVAFFSWGLLQLALRITVYPFLTWTALLRWGACYLIFFVTCQVFREPRELRIITWFLILLGFCVALEGLMQHFTAGNDIYWFRRLTLGGEPFGPYVNRNHFAGLMELLLPLGLAFLAFRGVRRDLVPLTFLFVLVPVGSLFVSASRAGLVVFAVELATLVVIFLGRKSGKIRIGPAIVFGLVAITFVVWLGAGKALQRFSTKRSQEITLERRRSMIEGAARVFAAHPVFGTGLGTLIVVFPRYDTAYDGKVVDHAHNDYVEALAELGLPGAVCGLAFLGLLMRGGLGALASRQSHFSFAYHAGALIACIGMLLHSLIDFNLHIPSNALIFLIQAGLLTSPALPSNFVSHRNQGISKTTQQLTEA